MATTQKTAPETLRTLMIEEIRDLYDAERQLVKALPAMAKGASSDELRSLIEAHLKETQGHVKRLERAFEMLGERPRGKHCAGIAGIIKEGSDLLDEDFEGAVLDAGIIAGAQRAEHYEMGAYGSVIAWAKQLSEAELASLLEETLEEEKGADKKLSTLAVGSINRQAASEAGRSTNGGNGAPIRDTGSRNGSGKRSMARSSSSRPGRNGSAGRSTSTRS